MGIMEQYKRVLVIDDDLDYQFMISALLGSRGFKVKCLLHGNDSSLLNLAKECDIVLLDIELPGIGGVELSKTLKADPSTAQIPIILISGCVNGPKLMNMSGANAFIGKPFSLLSLFDKINELLCNTAIVGKRILE
jgi:CheY-like chemotaxis protein